MLLVSAAGRSVTGRWDPWFPAALNATIKEMAEVHYIEHEGGPPRRMEVVRRTAETITYRQPAMTDEEFDAAVAAAAEPLEQADEASAAGDAPRPTNTAG